MIELQKNTKFEKLEIRSSSQYKIFLKIQFQQQIINQNKFQFS